MNILIIEDDIFLRWKIAEIFSQTRITNQVVQIDCMEGFYQIIHTLDIYDIILIDLEIPPYTDPGNGYKLIEMVRKRGMMIPIIIFSGNDTIESMRKAFQLGANDYITKPVRLRELKIRIENWFLQYRHKHLGRSEKSDTYHGLTYHVASYTFSFQGVELRLTKRERYLLFLFFMSRETMLKKEFLIEKLWWDFEQDSRRNISASVIRLKQALGASGIAHWIKNIHGEGYIFAFPEKKQATTHPKYTPHHIQSEVENHPLTFFWVERS